MSTALSLVPCAPAPLPLPQDKGFASSSSATRPLASLRESPARHPVNLEEAERLIRSQEERIQELENLALTDELTGLLNRRGLMNALRRELAASRRTGKSAGLLVLIDVDDFKLVNDLYGHNVGDSYLQTLGSVLLNEVRTSDYVARHGGDEFAVLLPAIGLRAAGARLDKLERAVNSRVMHSGQHTIPLRASFGFAILSETETPESLLATADSKLYASKARRKMGMKG